MKVISNLSKCEFSRKFYSLKPMEVELKISDALGVTIFSGNLETKVGKQNLPVKLTNWGGEFIFCF